jgi:hypothetical protein
MVEKPEGKNHLLDLGVNGKIILKWKRRMDSCGSGNKPVVANK